MGAPLPNNARHALLAPCASTISMGPCPPTVAGPYAAWMPRKSLQGCTCGVSCDGGRARAPQPTHRSATLGLIHQYCPITPRHPKIRLLASFEFSQRRARRGRGVLSTCGTRRKYVHVGSVAACMPPHGPASGEGTAPANVVVYRWEPESLRHPYGGELSKKSPICYPNKDRTRLAGCGLLSRLSAPRLPGAVPPRARPDVHARVRAAPSSVRSGRRRSRTAPGC